MFPIQIQKNKTVEFIQIMIHLLYLLVSLLIFEMTLRFLSLRYCPWYARLAHTLGLMSYCDYQEWRVIGLRVLRGGHRTYFKLLEHYSIVSGITLPDVEVLLRPRVPFEGVFSQAYKHCSGLHGTIQQHFTFPSGSRPVPNQTFRTLNICEEGFRKTVQGGKTDDERGNRVTVLVLGGSCVFGLGCMSDSATVPSRLASILEGTSVGEKFTVINGGMLGYTSMQQYLLLVSLRKHFDHIIVLDGWNELDQSLKGIETPSLVRHDLLTSRQSIIRSITTRFFTLSWLLGLIRIMRARSKDFPRVSAVMTPNVYPHS